MNKESFVDYLKYNLIPDLKESGHMQTAHDFEACLLFISGVEEIQFDKQTGSPSRSVPNDDKRLIDTLEWRVNHGEWNNS